MGWPIEFCAPGDGSGPEILYPPRADFVGWVTLPCALVVATVGATGWPYEPREGSRRSDLVLLGPLAEVIEP